MNEVNIGLLHPPRREITTKARNGLPASLGCHCRQDGLLPKKGDIAVGQARYFSGAVPNSWGDGAM